MNYLNYEKEIFNQSERNFKKLDNENLYKIKKKYFTRQFKKNNPLWKKYKESNKLLILPKIKNNKGVKKLKVIF